MHARMLSKPMVLFLQALASSICMHDRVLSEPPVSTVYTPVAYIGDWSESSPLLAPGRVPTCVVDLELLSTQRC